MLWKDSVLQNNKQQCESYTALKLASKNIIKKSFNKYISKNCHIVPPCNYPVVWAYSAISGELLEIETI